MITVEGDFRVSQLRKFQNEELKSAVSRFLVDCKTVLNVGAGPDDKDKFGVAYRDYFKGFSYFTADKNISAVNSNHYSVDAHDLGSIKKTFDTVLAFNLLEHTENPFVIAQQLIEKVKCEGYLFISVPFLYPEHVGPGGSFGDYWRMTLSGIKLLFKDCDLVYQAKAPSVIKVVEDKPAYWSADLAYSGGFVILKKSTQMRGEYGSRGNYHKEVDKNWSYYPVYTRKKEVIEGLVKKYVAAKHSILDAGCGEGVFVNRLIELGYNAIGVDLNYSSDVIVQGNICDLPFEDETFDSVLALDVIEHLDLSSQEKAIGELRRVLKKGGILFFSTPNLAHLESRISFFLGGPLVRTANVKKHPGDRPLAEFRRMLRAEQFETIESTSIKLTLPPVVLRGLTFCFGKRIVEKLIYSRVWPDGLCFLNIIVSKR